MSTFLRPSTLVTRGALAAALLVAWPSPGHTQQQDDSAASAASATNPGASSQQKDGDGDLPAATRRARADERRLLGGPRSTLDPYETGDPSPKSQEDALMDEQRMTIVSPSAFYSSGSPAMDGQGSAAGAGGGNAKRSFGRTSSSSSPDGTPAAPKRYEYSSGGTSVPVYRNPYEMQNTAAGQAYRSPW